MQDNKKQSVLIIESDSAVLKNLTGHFKKRGMLVITAKDGYEGYMRVCSEIPNYIIAESLLPSMSGFKIARLLKYDERYKNIPLVLLTDNDLDTMNNIFSASGADKILKKPFKFSDLLESIGLTTA